MDDTQPGLKQTAKPRAASAGAGPVDVDEIDDSSFGSPLAGPASHLDYGAASTSDARLSRKSSFSASSSYQDDWDLPPLDRIGVLDLLDNFTLPQQLEKLQKGLSRQTSKVRRSREAFKSRTQVAKDRMVEEWRRRVPSADEQLDRYKKRMRTRFDKLGKQWTDTRTIRRLVKQVEKFLGQDQSLRETGLRPMEILQGMASDGSPATSLFGTEKIIDLMLSHYEVSLNQTYEHCGSEADVPPR